MMVCVIKKALLLPLFLFLLGSSLLWAQDSVILKNGTEIQVKVLEVSSAQIKYKKQENPDGPLYTYSIKDVLLIKYANGTKDVFGSQSSSVTTALPEPNSPRIETVEQLRYRRGFCSGQFVSPQGNRLSGAETRQLLSATPAALDYYQRGKALRMGSYLTSAAAVGMIGGGLAVALLAGEGNGGEHHGWNLGPGDKENGIGDNRHDEHHNGDLTQAGYIVAGAGLLTGLVGIWLDHRVTINFKRAAEQYNNSRPVSLHFGPSTKGLGLGMALKF